MITYQGLDQIQLTLEAQPDVQKFTAIFCNYSGTTNASLLSISTIENAQLARQEVTYDKIVDLVNFKIILKPRAFTVSSQIAASFNTVLIIDKDTTANRLLDVTSWSGNTATLADTNLVVPKNSGFANGALFSQADVDSVGQVILNSSIGAPSQIVATGRYILATYIYATNIEIAAKGSARIQLGNINIKLS